MLISMTAEAEHSEHSHHFKSENKCRAFGGHLLTAFRHAAPLLLMAWQVESWIVQCLWLWIRLCLWKQSGVVDSSQCLILGCFHQKIWDRDIKSEFDLAI